MISYCFFQFLINLVYRATFLSNLSTLTRTSNRTKFAKLHHWSCKISCKKKLISTIILNHSTSLSVSNQSLVGFEKCRVVNDVLVIRIVESVDRLRVQRIELGVRFVDIRTRSLQVGEEGRIQRRVWLAWVLEVE